MGFMEAVKTCFTKYATFSGRARRSEYWYFCLFNAIAAVVMKVLALAIDLPLDTIYSVAVFIPGLAVVVRRLHDIGKSGWSYLFGLIPLVGWILLLVWFCKAGDWGDNAYGPDPKKA